MRESNIPNLITLGRFAIAPIVVILLLSDEFWAGCVAMILITIAGISDFIDGYLARHWHVESDVGKLLDPVADKVLVVASLIMLISLGRVHPILVVILVSREIFITGIRSIAGSKKMVIPASRAAKNKTIFQLIAIGGLAYHENLLFLNGHLVGMICLYISIILSLYSAVEYVRHFMKELNMKMMS